MQIRHVIIKVDDQDRALSFYTSIVGFVKRLDFLIPNPRPINSSASLRTILLDHPEHLRHNLHVSVAALRLLFTFTPERRSPSLRNLRSPSPEYPMENSRRTN